MSNNIAIIAVVFWIFVALITILPIVLHHRRRLETEKTIRLAIEKGQNLDPALLERLLGASAESSDNSTPTKMRSNGIITIFVGIGLAILSAFINAGPLIGVGCLVGCIGIGMYISAGFMAPDAPTKPSDKA